MSSPKAEKRHTERRVFFLVGEDGFEPSKRNAADLQSVPFGHSGTPPYSVQSVETEHAYYIMEFEFVKNYFCFLEKFLEVT